MSFDLQDILERAKGSSRVGDHEEAERLLKQYLAKVPDDRSVHLLLGTTLAKQEKLDEAVDEFTTLLAENPKDVEALNNLAVIYRRQDKLQDALGALMDAIDIDPVRAEFHYNIGNIHKQLGNLKSASMAYAKVIELNPDYVHAYNNLGTIYDQLREYEKAYSTFRKGLALDRNNPTLHFNYGVALEANNRFEDALNEYKSAQRSKPGWLQPMNNMGIIYFKQGQHTKAMDTFNRILHSDPLNAEARNNMGVVQADQGKIKEAVANYRRAIESDPKYVKAVVNLERALEDSGDFADAVVELEKLIKLVPNSADVRHRLAALYLKMERYPEALQQSQAALEWEPENTQALRILGATQRVIGNDAEAEKTFEKILTVDPGNYAFQLDLADIHFKRKEYKKAEERIMAFLSRRPNDREAKMLLGRLYAKMGNRTHAIQIFEELAKADPNDTEALAAAAELHKNAGETEKALRTADKLVNLQGKRATPDDLSDLNDSLAFYESAVKAYSSDVTDMWARNLKLLQDAVTEKKDEADDISLFMGMGEKSPLVDEETEALFIEEPDFGMEDTDELFLDDELPLYDEETQPDMSLDNMAEPDNEPFSEPWYQEPQKGQSGDHGPPPQQDYPPPQPQQDYPPQEQEPPDQPQQDYPPQEQEPPDQPQQDYPPQEQEPPAQPQQDYPPQEPQPPQPPPQPQPPPPQPQPQQPLQPQPPPRQPQQPWQPPPQYQQPQQPWPPQPRQQPQYPPGDEPEALPIDEEEEELALEDGGEEKPGEWEDSSDELDTAEEPDTTEEPDTAEFSGEDAVEDSDEILPDEAEAEDFLMDEDVFGEEEAESFEPDNSQSDLADESAPGSSPEEDFLDSLEDTPQDEASDLELDEPESDEPLFENEPEDFLDNLPADGALPQFPPASENKPALKDGTESKKEGLTRDAILGLMNYLKDMSSSLPQGKLEAFEKSDARLSMENVINTLKGKEGLLKGLKNKISQKDGLAGLKPNALPSKPVSREKIAGTLSYLENLSGSVNDTNLFSVLRQKVQSIMSRINNVMDKRQK
ncbi:MAG: tetratricopeptide repeat protein [Treponema sp.]|nr:tetratricopeptide repeat protein [Treponema sp.]